MARGRCGIGATVGSMDTVHPDFTAPTLALTLTLTLALALTLAVTPLPAGADPGVKPLPVRDAVKRRSVQQVIEPTARIVPYGDRPTLRVKPPAVLPAPLPMPSVPSPRLGTCDAGGCFDGSGARFNGSGAALLGPTGQLCTRGVVNAQCF